MSDAIIASRECAMIAKLSKFKLLVRVLFLVDKMTRSKQQRRLLCENVYLKYLSIMKRKKIGRPYKHAIHLNRTEFGEFHHLYKELRQDPVLFIRYTRMNITTFDYILENIREECKHVPTNFKKPIDVEERLILTLRFLATGTAFRQLGLSFRISKTAVGNIVIEVCKALWNMLQNKHLKFPTQSDFKTIAKQFNNTWKFPNCLGCIDGKHIRIKCPTQSGSMYYNYKNYFSIVLMAISDAQYRFTLIDVGAYGKDSDGGVLMNTKLHADLENGKIRLPERTTLPHSNIEAEYVFLGDEAFPLRTYLLRPFPRRQLVDDNKCLFNYRLSSTRMVIECAFGIMAAKFRILQKAIETKVENAVHIVKAICLLHNLIIDLEKPDYTRNQNLDDNQLHVLPQANLIQPKRLNRAPQTAIAVRQTFVEYFAQTRV